VRTLDRIFGWLMVALGFGQLLTVFLLGLGRFTIGPATNVREPYLLIAGTGMSLAVLLLGACNLMRADRPHDTTLAWVCVAGNVGWLAIMLTYAMTLPGRLIPATHGVVTLVLLVLSLRTRNRSRPL
jgi:hypothetical protein